MNLAPGTNLGPYEILGPLGAGGMGEVWRARDARIGRDVAIKVLPASFASDVDRLRRFEAEARAAGQLNDPNVLTVFDVGTHEGAPYLVTELLEGETLRERLADGPLPPQKALEIARQLARGLAAAHEHGIVHRDLKPENIFVMKDGRAKILDFGLARQADIPGAGQGSNSPTVPVKTEPGTVLGSIGYMAPEQVRGKPADARSDIFAFGAVLFEMLTGRKAFEGETAVEVLNAILKEDPPPPSTLRPALPRGVDLLVRRCLEKNPEERYRSARDLSFHIFALSTDSLVAQAPSSGFRAQPATTRRRWVISIATVVLTGAMVGLTALVLRRSEPAPLVFERLTYLHGSFLHARFAPDGQNVVFGASLEGRPTEVFLTREKSRGARPLGIGDSDVMSVSTSGDIAILRKTRFLWSTMGAGTLATVPLTGGSPREIATLVVAADVAPNGRDIALLRRTAAEHVVEYPPGNTILKSQQLGNVLRISPDGTSVLVAEWDARDGTRALVLVDRKGGKKTLSSGFRELTGAVFAPSGKEILATGNKGGASFGLLKIDMKGHERLVWQSLDLPILHDVARDGRLLLERSVARVSTLVGHRGDAAVKDLSWTDSLAANAFSSDGRSIVFRENRTGGSEASTAFFRSVDGSPPIQLGEGVPTSFSPDGRWVLTAQPGPKWGFTLLPVGPGTPRPLDTGSLSVIDGLIMPPDGRRILFGAADEAGKIGVYVMDIEKGKPRPLENMSPGAITWQISPDGRQLAMTTREKSLLLYDVEKGSERSVPNARPGELPFQWSADGRFIWIGNPGDLPVKIDRIDVVTGDRQEWLEVPSPVPPDVVEIAYVALSEDGATWLAVVNRVVASDLFIASGLVAR